jgi:mannose-1-phosphate guanylyltransferase
MYVVIMAGGSGTRFWPMSRKEKPKQFLNISGRDPLILETCDRVKPLARDEEMIIVVGDEHLGEAKTLLENRKVRIIAEPAGRNTAACIGLGTIFAKHLRCEGPIAFMPADHFVANPSAFVESLLRAEKVAESGAIVTLGIVPTRPETGYGYIQWEEERPDFWEQPAYRVSSFVEKPNLEKARQYLTRGDYFWNAGIFVATPQAILKEMEENLPSLYHGLMSLDKVIGTAAFDNLLEEVYEGLDSISFDYGVMERTKNPIFVIPCDCGWSDVGSWDSVYELREWDKDEDDNLTEGECLLVDSKKNFVSSRGGRLVACLGLKDCLVVDTPDALLVADLNRAQEVRKITERLKRNRRDDLL